MTSVLVRLIRDELGAEGVEKLLGQAATTHDEDYLSQPDNWVSIDEAVSLLDTAQRITGDTTLARRVGEQAVRQHAGTQVATLQRSMGSPEALLASIAISSGRFSTVTEMAAVSTEPGRAVITARARPGYVRHKLHCDWSAGLLAATSVLFGLPPAHVDETECEAQGGRHCCYSITWDADEAAEAADPNKRVTALEAQLIGMSERLRSVYETASDLISPDELDVVLPRILDRAATTVRAPRYVLAVRTAPAAELRVYCDGVDEDQARAIVASVELGHEVGTSGVVAPIASGRQTYGHLIALNAEGSPFFPQERELLELYAQHAAAVLDMSTALDTSARRHRDVSALLALSESLAQAGMSSDVGTRLAEAIPSVVDCDYVAVYGWDQEARSLVPLAARAHRDGEALVVSARRLLGANSALIDGLIANRRPRLFDRTPDDTAIARVMIEGEFKALAVVPIVARDAFLGALVLAVTDEPGRLAHSDELLERLTGVAALAAPPLQNGRLIDELRHQATHDPLTSLLNRAGFQDHMSRTLEAATGHVGLLFIDLDGFKPINDTHGHHVGDELLRISAQRLTKLVRADDAPARLGGDEFAVVLGQVESAVELEAAAQRVRDAFAAPFVVGDVTVSLSASVGGALWPEAGRGIEELMRRADSAMYLQKPAAGPLARR